jgi:hypothetical protein
MGDINLATASFTSKGMILAGTETLTSAYGSNLANNIGWLLSRPIPLWSCNIPIRWAETKEGSSVPVEATISLQTGTWTLYYSMTGSYNSKYLYPGHYYFPNISLDGSLVVTGVGTWISKSGSFVWPVDGHKIEIELSADDVADTDHICGYISIYGVRNSGDIHT